MNHLLSFYPGDNALFFAAKILLQITVVSVIALALLHALGRHRAALRYAVAVCALAAMLAGPLVSWSLTRAGVPAYQLPVRADRWSRNNAHAAPPAMNAVPSIVLDRGAGSAAQVAPSPLSITPANPAPDASRAPAGDWVRAMLTVLYCGWLAGMAVLFVRLIHGLGFQRAFCREGKAIDREA